MYNYDSDSGDRMSACSKCKSFDILFGNHTMHIAPFANYKPLLIIYLKE